MFDERFGKINMERIWKEAWFSDNGPCKYCASWNRLEYDHIDLSTKDPILKKNSNAIWGWSETRRNKELVKCQILCNSCHLENSRIKYLSRKKLVIINEK